MKTFGKNTVIIILHICIANSLQFQGNHIFDISFQNSTYSKRAILNATQEMELQYEMLIDFELRRFQLIKDSVENGGVYSDLFVIRTNNTQEVKDVIEKCKFTFIRKVFEDEDYYLFRRSGSHRKCHRNARKFLRLKLPSIDRQILKNRVKRNLEFDDLAKVIEQDLLFSKYEKLSKEKISAPSRETDIEFNDPLFPEQWYLHNFGQTGSPPENDINVLPVWQSGITGRGVSISVLDDGIYRHSAEVADNYDFLASEDFLYLNKTFHPIQENSHGTYCAAIAAGVANNKICGVGVAYEAKVGGVRILDGPLTDVQEALALVHALDHVDIYTASWGPNDDGSSVDGPGILTRTALVRGVTMGRGGKGAIYVWAAGNGGGYYDNCNLDGYASSPFTLTIGALTEYGKSTYYSEPCAAVIASTYVGGISHIPSFAERQSNKNKVKVVVPEGRGKCKETFQGTSAAAPMAAGVIALALQANPYLTWRDIQHIIIRTSRIPATGEDGWLINGAGFNFHPKIGSGVLDADALVKLARKWKPARTLNIWTTPAVEETRPLLPNQFTTITMMITKSAMHPLYRIINRLETVTATINLYHPRCGDLEIVLESPAGTESQILTKRPYDNRTSEFPYWNFATLHFWGEDPEGQWTLRIVNTSNELSGYIDYFSLILHGTEY